jgi:lantibiotic biosynthesis protein
VSNWDPLHGMVGLGIYFLERNLETREEIYLVNIVEALSDMRRAYGKYNIWITAGVDTYSKDNFNFGMAHGMPGILSFLAQVNARKIKEQQTREMIYSCLPFLLEHENDDRSVSCFPSFVDVDPADNGANKNTRLAWCYGDLCVANALIHCGKALGNRQWVDKGIGVALRSTSRSFYDSGCVDSSFCHGSVGLLHQYGRLYRLTGNETFKDTCQRWLNTTLEEFYRPKKGASGYLSRIYNEAEKRSQMVSQDGLLEGNTGIALVYLCWLYSIQPEWDILFQTNV